MKKYDSMKPATVFWLGDIPEHWECLKIGSLFSQRKVKVSDKDYAPLSVTKMGILPQLENAAKSDDSDNRKLVCVGDFVINSRSDRKGSCGVSELNGSVSLINLVLTPRNEWNNRYVHYLMRSQPFSEEYYRYGRGIVADLWTTRFSEMKNIQLPVPPRDEQDQIVRFLDWKVSQISRLINNLKRYIDMLNLLKRNIIEEIIGQCNVSTVKLKHISFCNPDVLSESTNKDYEFKYIDIGSVDFENGITQYQKICFGNAPSRARRIVKKNDIIVSTVRTYLRAVAQIIDDDNVIVSTGFAVIRPKSDLIDSKFIEYYCKSDTFCNEVIRLSNGIAYPAINSSALMNIKIPYPPIYKQKVLSESVENKCKNIDHTIRLQKDKISLLYEFKTRLISDVVTGKIDVRGIEIPEYEYISEETDEMMKDKNDDTEEDFDEE